MSLIGLVACSKTPATDRIQFNLIPDGIMEPLGQAAYQEMLAAETLGKGTARHDTLQKVGPPVSTVANQPGYKCRYALIRDDETINACCLPGGKIAF